MTALVSVVLPTHNGRRYIRQSIDSVLVQTLDDFELIVVDDASADDTADIVSSYHDPRLRLIRLTQNAKLPGALNIGFRETRAPYLTWTSDDNWYAPNALEKLHGQLAQDSTLGMVYSHAYLVDDSGDIAGEAPVRPMTGFDDNPWNPVGASFMYTRVAYERVGDYNESYRLVEDFDYWLRIAAAFPTTIIPEYLYYYRVHPGSLTGQHSFHGARLTMDLLRDGGYMSPAAHRRWIAWLDHNQAYDSWKNKHNRRETLHYASSALSGDPKYWRDKGVVRALVWSLIGDGLYGQLQRFKPDESGTTMTAPTGVFEENHRE